MARSSARTVAAYTGTPQLEDLIKGVAKKTGAFGVATHQGGLATAARLAGRDGAGQLVIAELGDMALDEAAESLQALAANGQSTILLGKENDVALYRAMLAAGARDYLVLPVSPEDLLAAMERNGTGASPEAASRGRVTGICGVSGGVGASFIASSLAWLLAAEAKRRTALVDLDLAFGSIAVDFDITPTGGLLEALGNPARVDETFLETTMTQVSDRLSIYAAETALDSGTQDLSRGMPLLLHRMARHQDHVVADIPRGVLLQSAELCAALDEVILVLAPGFATARACGRIQQRLNEIAPDLKVIPVLSHCRRDAGLKPEELSSVLETPIACTLPHAAAALSRAAIKGRPVTDTDPRSGLSQALQRLCRELTGTEKPASFWTRLTRRS